jgi:hypothetical protein
MREHFREVHHHERGSCDLQEFLTEFLRGRWIRTDCYLQWWSEQRICSCGLCSQAAAGRRDRRRDRQGTRRDLRAAAGQWAAGELDEDGPAPRRPTEW